ncbi:deoxycytidine triphosphate deaminase [Candidatus Saccharibacteria bacterium]|nr:deoxycytidine triphosphate deaminase [Candidatus Saccharibacteria bacterium]
MSNNEQHTKFGVYSDTEIIQAIQEGHIIQYPDAPELINASSVDVRLGYNFYRTDLATINKGIYNPYDEEDVQRYFGEPLEAVPLREHGTIRRKLGLEALKGIDPDHPLIILRPGERILGHTHEFIGIDETGTSSMQAKSTTGRNGITVCKDAGWGDPGYFNRWTMEIENSNEREHVPLPIGMAIAQLVFYHTGPVNASYRQLSGNYQQSSDVNELIRTWAPNQMLPRTYRKQVQLPPLINNSAYK